MAYVKQTWQTGDTVTSAKLNHMEDGIAAAGDAALVVGSTVEGSTTTLNKTYAEILAGNYVAVIIPDEGWSTRGHIVRVGEVKGTLTVDCFIGSSTTLSFTASTENDYPSCTGG